MKTTNALHRLIAFMTVSYLSICLAAQAAISELPAELRVLVWPGAQFAARSDVGRISWRLAGHLQDGTDYMEALNGSMRYEFKLDLADTMRNDEARPMALRLFRYYDKAVAKLGARRLNILEHEPKDGREVNAKLFLYSVPSPEGEFQLGVWIQEAGERHFLVRFGDASTTKPMAAAEMKARLSAFGHAPLYIHFDTNKADLKSDETQAVRTVAGLMTQDRTLKLSIEGHTDDVGRPADNKKLSQARADAVMGAVIAQGIEASRLKAVGHGQEHPVADNRKEEGRAKNRRVELVKLP